MATDFGQGRERGLGPLPVIGMVVLIGGLACIPGWLALETWMGIEKEKRDWAVEGPACPVVDAPSPAMLGKKPLKTFTYGDVTFTRKVGDVDCVGLHEPAPPWATPPVYRVCQFTAPGIVGVSYRGQTTWYQPGWAKPTTVTVRHGKPSCVVAGWFRRK